MKSESLILAKRYARALCAALKTEDLPAVIADMEIIAAALDKAAAAFYNPAVAKEAKKRALAGIAQNNILQNLLNIMADNKRLRLLGAVKDETQNILDERAGVLRTEITFAAIPENKKEIENILKKLFKAQSVCAVYKEDKNIIGGVKIKAGDILIDGSAANNLEKLKTILS
ncbi:MAG: ATP synthase F1 subunit delta [Elusimicrobium sp.]|jgi:F-type H+-transporting ATPase subunit delta|nr:ATP synthase F1 subunit delta [Elusimicrobium sp.]